jgi:hypothetical protein
LQLIFQSDKKTLENKQIDHIIILQLLLTEEFGALIRENRLNSIYKIINYFIELSASNNCYNFNFIISLDEGETNLFYYKLNYILKRSEVL